jgi:hypothetical protein
MERAASQVSGGEITSFETVEKRYVTPELGYVALRWRGSVKSAM